MVECNASQPSGRNCLDPHEQELLPIGRIPPSVTTFAAYADPQSSQTATVRSWSPRTITSGIKNGPSNFNPSHKPGTGLGQENFTSYRSFPRSAAREDVAIRSRTAAFERREPTATRRANVGRSRAERVATAVSVDSVENNGCRIRTGPNSRAMRSSSQIKTAVVPSRVELEGALFVLWLEHEHV